MTYEQLTINQKISLKGLFRSDPTLRVYGLVMELWDYRWAIRWFLNEEDMPPMEHSEY